MTPMNMASKRFSRIGRTWLAGTGVLLSACLGGCVSYTNVPVPESAPAFESANHMQSIAVVTRALDTVITKHPVVGSYSINLPAGTTPETFEKIMASLPAGATMPFDGMDADMPVYHIGRIWIRASDAKVDVVYPFTDYDGVIEDQSVTVWLGGGVRKWRVYREQHWSAGTIPTPPIYRPIWDDSEQAISGDESESVEANEAIESMEDIPPTEPLQESVPADEPASEPAPEAMPSDGTEVGNGMSSGLNNETGYREVPIREGE